MIIGDARYELSKDFLVSLERVINDNSHKREKYYIFVYTRWEDGGGTLHTRFVVMDEKPPAYMSTMCISVDNRSGRVDFEHALPLDIPKDGVEMSDKMSQIVYNSALKNDSPVVNN